MGGLLRFPSPATLCPSSSEAEKARCGFLQDLEFPPLCVQSTLEMWTFPTSATTVALPCSHPRPSLETPQLTECLTAMSWLVDLVWEVPMLPSPWSATLSCPGARLRMFWLWPRLK